MPPNRETFVGSYNKTNNDQKPPRLSMESLQRTMSDISLELTKKATTENITILPPISEVEDAKCECCGMSEECTNEYINRIRGKFLGKLICGLCAEAVNEEMAKNGGKKEEALNEHVSACVRFNSFGRTHPVLYQAEAMRELLKKSSRAKSISPRDKGMAINKGGIARSSSCIAAITRETSGARMVN